MSSTCPFCQKKKNPCAFCEKPGLPILPLRYAVARADRGEAPQLSAPFGPGVSDIALPDKDAHYSMRLLRPGYLYVFNEKRVKWHAYVVTQESYLFDFEPGKAPPDVSNIKFSCTRAGDALLARCFNVEDANTAGKIWIGFSEVAWTPKVLANHADENYRKAHMRSVDIAAWLNGSHNQPHAAPITELTKHAAEFAAASPPSKVPAVNTLADIIRKGFIQSSQYLKALKEMLAFDFSPHRFHDFSGQVPELLAVANQACATHKPMLLGLADPAGIAMELNSLAITRALEWMEEPERKWKYATATAIAGIREAVLNGAVKEQSEKQKQAATTGIALLNMLSPTYARARGVNLLHQDIIPGQPTNVDRVVESAGEVSSTDIQRLSVESWSKYQKMYNETERENFLKQYAQEFGTLEKATIKPLDTAYLAWLKSASFKAYFIRNFDPTNIDSGISYQQTVYACIKEATGRTAVVDYFKQCLGNDPAQPGEIILRALLFNQDKLAKKVNEAAAEKGREVELPAWIEAAEKIYGALKEIIGKEDAEELKGPLAGISRYIFQLSAPILERLNAAAAAGINAGARFALPEQRLLSLMQSMLTAEGKNKVLFDASGYQTRKQAARALAGFLATLSGGDEQQWRSGARVLLDDATKGRPQAYPYRGLFVVDKSEVAKLQSENGRQRTANVLSAADETEFETLMKKNAKYLVSSEATASGLGLIITAFSLKNSFGEIAKAEPDAKVGKSINFGSGIASAAGEVGQIISGIFNKFAWGATKLNKPITTILGTLETRADLLFKGPGKVLGVIGGVVAGGVQIYEGIKSANDGDAAFGFGNIILGIGTAVLPILVAFGVISAGIGLVIVLVMVAASYLISLLKHDKLQHWLDACYFGKHDLGENSKFKNLPDQDKSYAAMAKGN